MSVPVKDLYEFLTEAELQHYYNGFHNDLKITTIPQIKYAEEDDLLDLGMSKPEIRRLKKFFRKECPQGAFGKIRKLSSQILGSAGRDGSSRPNSPPVERASPHAKPSKHIIPRETIVLCKALGAGEFGTVQQGVWTNEDGERVQVAIKCLSKDKMHHAVADFLKEASIMHAIDHDHIVRLYGVVLETDSLMLVTELAPLRSLLECLKEPALRASFPVVVLCDFAYQIADGMAYLEGKRLIHRDLAARNILVFAKDKVKISDFGLSRALGVGKDYYQTNFNVNLKLPIAWCAPECINYLKFTSASDVWAYAVALWEMFSYGFQPWAAFTGEQILEAIDEPNCQRLEQPDYCPREFYYIMLKCWDHDAKKRPTFQEILRLLPQIKPEQVQAVQDPALSRSEFLHYKSTDVITVLDKKPPNAPSPSTWKGVLENGKIGLFDTADTTPYIEIKTLSPLRSKKISRRESSRKSLKGARHSKLKADMISRPQNDLRHTGHIGYDGAVFGDVSFIGDNYDKLPVKVVSPYKPQDDLAGSPAVPPDGDDLKKVSGSESQASLASSIMSTSTIGVSSYRSFSTSQSQDTLTDVSSMHDGDSVKFRSNGRTSPLAYEDVDDGFGDFGDFKMPDFSTSLDLDLGPSFMDEVMKSLNEALDQPSTNGKSADDKSPLLDSSSTYTNGQSTFDNSALTTSSHGHDDLDSMVSVSSQSSQPSSKSSSQSPRESRWKPKLRLEEQAQSADTEEESDAETITSDHSDHQESDQSDALSDYNEPKITYRHSNQDNGSQSKSVGSYGNQPKASTSIATQRYSDISFGDHEDLDYL